MDCYLIERGFAASFDAFEVCADVNSNMGISEQGGDFRSGDFDFGDIEPDTDDFIIRHGVLHHLINLELVLHWRNRALRSDGVLLIHEYIGEDWWQLWSERIQILKRSFPKVDFALPPLWALPGFESVRSSDLLPILHRCFSAVCKREVLHLNCQRLRRRL